MKMMPQQYCLRWKHHHSNVQSMFAQLLEKERFCDVTLYCSPNFASQVPFRDTVEAQSIRGVSLRAHRVVLAACSELLGSLLGAHEEQGEPVLVIDGAEPKHVRALLDYMYTGEMNVHHSQLASLLKTAEELRIKGLTDIRWNNKDEPPDSHSGIVTTTSIKQIPEKKSPEKKDTRLEVDMKMDKEEKKTQKNKERVTEPIVVSDIMNPELQKYVKMEDGEEKGDKFSVNGGPPPLIKLPSRDKSSPFKREHSDTESPSPKRQRMISATEHTDDDSISVKIDRDAEWQHGNLDISAERVVGWGMGSPPEPGGAGGAGEAGEAGGGGHQWSRGNSDDEWEHAPADIGSFLTTRLRVDGDNSNDDESNESQALALSASTSTSTSTSTGLGLGDIKLEHPTNAAKLTVGPKSGPSDPRFTDVIKLNDYLQHGRRPQFWEENYVKRVMEAVRLKDLEMKQAAEILGVSYGTLYGRYRDVYGCINRPYRTARDFCMAKGPSEVLDRLQKGEITLDIASQALGVTTTNLAAYISDIPMPPDKGAKEFEPIPIEMDPMLHIKQRQKQIKEKYQKQASNSEKTMRRVVVGCMDGEDSIPATVITTSTPSTATSKWPSIRVASLETLRDGPVPGQPTSPSQLMRTRPDLTIVAAKKPDKAGKDEDSCDSS